MNAPAELVLDDNHQYWMGSERIVGVSEALSQIVNWSMVAPDVLERKRQIGVAVHRACELDDLGDLDESSVDGEIMGYLEALRSFARHHNPTWTAIEEIVFNPVHRYAGTLDGIAIIDGERVLIDRKTGAFMPSHGPQLSAYLEAAGLPKPTPRWCVLLRDDGAYRVHKVATPHAEDFAVFVACLVLHRYRSRHG